MGASGTLTCYWFHGAQKLFDDLAGSRRLRLAQQKMAASIGEKLRLEREAQGIALRDISEQTRISMRYLEAIETDDYRRLPGGIFNRSFIRAYAKFVGFDEQEAMEEYTRTLHEHGESEEEDSPKPRISGLHRRRPSPIAADDTFAGDHNPGSAFTCRVGRTAFLPAQRGAANQSTLCARQLAKCEAVGRQDSVAARLSKSQRRAGTSSLFRGVRTRSHCANPQCAQSCVDVLKPKAPSTLSNYPQWPATTAGIFILR